MAKYKGENSMEINEDSYMEQRENLLYGGEEPEEPEDLTLQDIKDWLKENDRKIPYLSTKSGVSPATLYRIFEGKLLLENVRDKTKYKIWEAIKYC